MQLLQKNIIVCYNELKKNVSIKIILKGILLLFFHAYHFFEFIFKKRDQGGFWILFFKNFQLPKHEFPSLVKN